MRKLLRNEMGQKLYCEICDDPFREGDEQVTIPAIGFMHAFHEFDSDRLNRWRTWA